MIKIGISFEYQDVLVTRGKKHGKNYQTIGINITWLR